MQTVSYVFPFTMGVVFSDRLICSIESLGTRLTIFVPACQEILGVLIGLSTAVTFCGFPLRGLESRDMQIMLFFLPIMLCSYARAPALLCPRKCLLCSKSCPLCFKILMTSSDFYTLFDDK